jgi:dephospho-CoA kinase
MPLEEKKARADVVIDNNGDLESTNRQIDKAWNEEISK